MVASLAWGGWSCSVGWGGHVGGVGLRSACACGGSRLFGAGSGFCVGWRAARGGLVSVILVGGGGVGAGLLSFDGVWTLS